ncbi:MAG: hypothetical protein RIK87_26615 [Fuerstiella sp.]
MAARSAAQELDDTITIRVLPGAVRTGVVNAVIASGTTAGAVFRELLEGGRVSRPDAVAQFIVGVLVDASNELLQTVDAWDYHNLDHQALLRAPYTS